ncbi:hypothetical protein NQ317_016581 [Molorchus minor]|uniref:Tyr recombinase domain-containing protein n=1 Tax=Molorchus minor TaxID=1323400 RepID=A0ABQ9IZE7_9CUCU|nr:hypothetical protein NQ317_016581 [Molorchus minor]
MLKSTLNVKENLKTILRNLRYLLTPEEFNQFIREADDEIYLMVKVVLILGISDVCRREELTKMTVDDIEDKDSIFIVKVPDTKTNIQRIFTVSNLIILTFTENMLLFVQVILQVADCFLSIKIKDFFNQVVGINCIGKMPSLKAKIPKITKFLC